MKLTDSAIIEALEDGKQIRRSGWSDCYGDIELSGPATLWDTADSMPTVADLYELTADDWEAVGCTAK